MSNRDEALEIYKEYTSTEEHFEDAYMGHYETSHYLDSPLKAYADQHVEDMGWYEILPRESYFDLDSFTRDLECSGWFSEDGHVFRPV